MAEQKTSSGTRATGISHSSPNAGRQCKATKKMTITQDWKKKNTDAEPTDANARISRGNETFFTSPALLTMAPVAVSTEVWNRFQASKPENSRITNSG